MAKRAAEAVTANVNGGGPAVALTPREQEAPKAPASPPPRTPDGSSIFDYHQAGAGLMVERVQVGPRTRPIYRDDIGSCGIWPDTPALKEAVVAKVGGGTYVVRAPDGKVFNFTHPSPSLPISPDDDYDDDEELPRGHAYPHPVGGHHYPQQALPLPPPSPLMALQQQQASASSVRDREELRDLRAEHKTLQAKIEQLQADLAQARGSADRAKDALERTEREHARALEAMRDRAALDAQLAEMRARMEAPRGKDPTEIQMQMQRESEKSFREMFLAMLSNKDRDPLQVAAELAKLTRGKETDQIGQMTQLFQLMQMLREQSGGDGDESLAGIVKEGIKAFSGGLGQGAKQASQAPASTQNNPAPGLPGPEASPQEEHMLARLRRYGDVLNHALDYAAEGIPGNSAADFVLGYAARYGKEFRAEFLRTCRAGTVDESVAEMRKQLSLDFIDYIPEDVQAPLLRAREFLSRPAGEQWMRAFLGAYKAAPAPAQGQE